MGYPWDGIYDSAGLGERGVLCKCGEGARWLERREEASTVDRRKALVVTDISLIFFHLTLSVWSSY